MVHFDDRVPEELTRQQSLDGMLKRADIGVAAVLQNEVAPVLGDRLAELVERGHAVHRERGPVGVGNGLIRLDQDDTLTQAGHDLPHPVATIRHLASPPSG